MVSTQLEVKIKIDKKFPQLEVNIKKCLEATENNTYSYTYSYTYVSYTVVSW